MVSEFNYWTQIREDGRWEAKREGATRASKVFDTQAEAWVYTKERARKAGGEAFLKGRNNEIRERNTYGHDPANIPG